MPAKGAFFHVILSIMIYGKQSNRGKILKYFQKTIFAGIYFMSFTFDQSKNEIARLVKHFSTNQVAFLAQGYKEAQARQEFIDPLFIALNWDVHNQQQTAPEYREVIVEDSLEMAGHEARKAPDYVFRIGRERKFFAEAKKPGVDLKTAAGPAYQLRRYAWSAKLPLSVLTDFQEWVAYDCRIRPSEGDKTSTARLAYMTYEEYADRWREIWDVFSREAVWGGSFDQFAQGGKGKRGTSEVDAEFLKEIESWRDSLAHNIALRNPDLTLEEMNDAVQRTIDRIIFLRMGEARGMEEYGQLQRIADRENIYAGLLALSKKADAKYNSGLFDFSKAGDQVTPRLLVDDKTLKPILADLYYPQSPYEFSVLPVEILGNVYEQFLGKVIHLTESHHAKVEEKPEVKKGGGVYYTPSSIVEYIVKNTVGKQVEGKSPAELLGFRVLDPACGSGSFLLGAYTYLLDYYRNWYSTHEPGKNKKSVTQQADGSWQLTLPERKRILIENIFGVDIDHQAVEVTKLSLLLKVLEGVRQLTLFTERALPNLDDNIKCGNSLIGTDYFDLQLKPDDKELRRVNPFDWKQGFPE
ncbi:MAG: N-6 DNA methylase, partial [Anaerolineales bacterium]